MSDYEGLVYDVEERPDGFYFRFNLDQHPDAEWTGPYATADQAKAAIIAALTAIYADFATYVFN